MTATASFAIRTTDAAWIARNRGRADEAGRIIVQVPASLVEKTTMAGRLWLRHRFADIPSDALNGTILCLAAWVEDAAATARRPEALSGKALFLARAQSAGIARLQKIMPTQRIKKAMSQSQPCEFKTDPDDPAIRVCVTHDPSLGLYDDEECAGNV